MPAPKKILIAPRYNEVTSTQVTITEASLANYLIDMGFLPFSISFHTGRESQNSFSTLVANYLDNADAVILQGGMDICPSIYGQANYHAKGILRFRDFFELELIKQSVQAKLPIFAMCRGMQMINVFFGGTLHQDLPVGKWQKHSFDQEGGEYNLIAKQKKYHAVNLEPNSLLQKALQMEEIWVNSFHHQGIDKLGENLQVEGKSPDGLVEAFSYEKQKILATQWHPEFDPYRSEYSKIFELWLNWL